MKAEAHEDEDAQAPSTPVALGYARFDPIARTRLWKRRASTVVLIISAISVASGFGWRAARNWSDWRAQERYATFIEPPETITLDVNQGMSHVAFTHELSRPDGEKRIVLVDVIVVSDQGSMTFLTTVVPRIALLGAATTSPMKSTSPRFYVDRLHAGQVDPKDGSHFTIEYESRNGKGTIDGWLMNDDTVKFEARDGPLSSN